MEIHQVRYFLAVAETLNFTNAAERCNVSQPALTRAIQLLEYELGGLLFRRERANTHLTELGQMVRPFLQQSFEAAQRTKRLAEEFAQAQKKTLKVGIMCTIAPDQIIDLIATMRKLNADVELQLSDANAWDLEKQLLEGKLEVAVYCLPGKEPHEKTHVMPLFREQIVIAINPNHRLAKQSAIRVKDLDGEHYIHRMNCEFAGYADPVFAAQNVKCKAAYWSDRDDWTLAMVAAGIGWAFMPMNSVKHPGVVGIPITEPEFSRVVNLVSVRGREHTPRSARFCVRLCGTSGSVRPRSRSSRRRNEHAWRHGSHVPALANDIRPSMTIRTAITSPMSNWSSATGECALAQVDNSCTRRSIVAS